MSTIFGGNTGMTYEDVQRKRKVANALLARNASQTPRNVGEGLHAVGQALMIRGINKRADAADKENRSAFDDKWGGILGALGGSGDYGAAGSTSFGSAPAPNPNDAMYPTAQTGPAPEGNVDPASGLDMGSSGSNTQVKYRDGIAAIESDGSGGYDAVGATNEKLGRALGRYQIMEANLPQWSKAALGREVTADEFMKNPDIQDAIFDHKFGGYVEKYGEEGAAQAWFGGDGGVGKTSRSDVHGRLTIGDYGRNFVSNIGGAGGSGGVKTASSGGMDQATIMKMSEIANDPYASPGQKAVINQLLQRQMQASDPMRQMQMKKMQMEIDAIQNPVVDPMDAVKLKQAELDYLQDSNPEPEPGYRRLSPEEAMANGLGEGAFQVSPDGKVSKIGGGGVTVNNLGQSQPDIGAIPQGYALIKDDRQPSGYRMVAIPGGPKDTSENDAVAEANKERSVAVVTKDISRALGIIEKDPSWTTGLGAILKGVPGTQAKSLSGVLQTIKANVGFDRLQQMRDASKTGGALGAINTTEMELLQSVLGNLEQDLSPEDLSWNLRRVNEIYMDIIHGEGNRPPPPPDAGFSGASLKDMNAVDIGSLSDTEMDAWEARMKELGY